jgi:hypothetical protein
MGLGFAFTCRFNFEYSKTKEITFATQLKNCEARKGLGSLVKGRPEGWLARVEMMARESSRPGATTECGSVGERVAEKHDGALNALFS